MPNPDKNVSEGGWLADKNADLQEDAKIAPAKELELIDSPECLPNLNARFKYYAFPDNRGIDLDQRKNVSIGQGAWYNAAWHIATTICTPAAYATLPGAFAWLGWPAGIVCLFIGTVVSYYNSFILSALSQGPNGERRTRYAIVAKEIWGVWGWRAVTFFQQLASIGNNIAVEIAAALAMQTIYNFYYPDCGNMSTQKFIAIFAAFQLILSQLPDIHALRFLNIFSTFCTVGFTVTFLYLAVYEGRKWRAYGTPAGWLTGYSYISYSHIGSSTDVLMGIFMSLGTITFAFGDTILPEIQATIKEPAVKNTQWGLLCAYGIIAANYYIVAVSGYWAAGFNAANYPWMPALFMDPYQIVILVNLFGLFQIAGCFQIYCRPTYEWAENVFMDFKQGPWSMRNVICRLLITTTYSIFMTLISCAIPFFGSFLALIGSVGFTPLDYIIPVLLHNSSMKPSLPRRIAHYLCALTFIVIAILGFIGASYWINYFISIYSFFGNVGCPAPLAPLDYPPASG